MENKNLWNTYSEEQIEELQQVNEDYKTYLDNGKTERECVRVAVKRLEECGFRSAIMAAMQACTEKANSM